MCVRRIAPAALTIALAIATACDPPANPGPPPADGGGGAGGGGGGGGGGTPDPTSTLQLVVDRRGGPERASAIDLEVVGLAFFYGDAPAYVNERTPCDGGSGGLLDARTTVALDLTKTGRTPLASVDRTGEGDLSEVWLVLRQGVLHRDGRSYKVHAGALCTMPDDLQYTLVRLRPDAPVALGGADYDLVVPFDAAGVTEDRVDCRRSTAEECRTSDDANDDGNANTRLRFAFEPALPLLPERR